MQCRLQKPVSEFQMVIEKYGKGVKGNSKQCDECVLKNQAAEKKAKPKKRPAGAEKGACRYRGGRNKSKEYRACDEKIWGAEEQCRAKQEKSTKGVMGLHRYPVKL